MSSSSSSSSSSSAGLMQVSQLAEQWARQLFDWGTQQFGQLSDITDANIDRYLQGFDQAMGLAGNNIGRYEGLFQPQEDALIRDANTYASPSRIAMEMGNAESGVGQAMDRGRAGAIRDLESYGIDPSSGRYASLDRATAAQDAAARAGAAQQARVATEAAGRSLRGQAIQVGQQYPGQAVNALNSAYQGVAGSMNAALGRANAGVALKGLPNNYLQTAQQIRSGGSSSSSQRSDPQNQRGNQSQQGGNGTGGPGSIPNSYANAGGSKTSTVGFQPMGAPGSGQGGGADSFGEGTDPYLMGQGEFDGGFGSPNPYWDPNSPDFGAALGGYDNPDNQGSFGGGFSNFQSGDYGGSGIDPSAGFQGDQMDPWSSPSFSQFGDAGGSYGTGGFSQGDYGSTGDQGMGFGGDYGAYDFGGGGDSGNYGDFAQGGAVPGAPTTGGYVPPGASPSAGAQTDDVKANLNAGEFVVPRDVAEWKGQEFFQKLIMQSRKARLTAPGRGQPGPSRPGPTNFVSQQAA